MPPPGDELAQALSKEHAVSALLALLDEPGLTFTRLGVAMGGVPQSGRPMAEHLALWGLARIDEGPGPFPGQMKYAVTLTTRGKRVAEGLRTPAALMEKR